MRYNFKSYVAEALTNVSQTGLPVNRPLFWDFPSDAATWDIDDHYMFGNKARMPAQAADA